MDPIAFEEYSSDRRPNPENDELKVCRDVLAHPYDWRRFDRLVGGVAEELTRWPEVNRLVVVGGGCGFEAAWIVRRCSRISQVIVSDIGHRACSLSRRTFSRLGVPEPSALVCDFNHLAFGDGQFGPETCGLAFRCLHHSDCIETPIAEMMRVFDRLIVVEPVWNALVRFLAAWGYANREEHVAGHVPTRVSIEALPKTGWQIRKRFLLEAPRDRLPGLQARQGVFGTEDVSRREKYLSNVYDRIVCAVGGLADVFKLGNYVQLTFCRERTVQGRLTTGQVSGN